MITLNPEILARAYDYLQSTQPFCKWNLPDSDDITFKVIRTKKLFGQHYRLNGKHVLEVSSGMHGHSNTLLSTIAHEMIHIHQDEAGMSRRGTEHNAAFHKLASRVCKVHGWDPKLF